MRTVKALGIHIPKDRKIMVENKDGTSKFKFLEPKNLVFKLDKFLDDTLYIEVGSEILPVIGITQTSPNEFNSIVNSSYLTTLGSIKRMEKEKFEADLDYVESYDCYKLVHIQDINRVPSEMVSITMEFNTLEEALEMAKKLNEYDEQVYMNTLRTYECPLVPNNLFLGYDPDFMEWEDIDIKKGDY